MDVRELTRDQLEELKETYLWETENDYVFSHEIPDGVIFEHYGGICFVNDEFFSSFIESRPLMLPF